MGICHRTNVTSEVLTAELVIQQFLQRQLAFSFQAGSVLRYVERRAAVPIAEPFEQLSKAERVGSQPDGLCFGTNPHAVFVLIQDLEISGEVFKCSLAVLVPNVVGAVMVHAIEVIAALDKRNFLLSELWQSATQLLAHRVWVLAKVDWVSEPGDGKFNLAVGCFDVFRVFWVPRLRPIAYTSSADVPSHDPRRSHCFFAVFKACRFEGPRSNLFA